MNTWNSPTGRHRSGLEKKDTVTWQTVAKASRHDDDFMRLKPSVFLSVSIAFFHPDVMFSAVNYRMCICDSETTGGY